MAKTRHPEQKDDEVFIENCVYEDIFTSGWTEKNWGSVAYDASGKPINGYYPLFVKRTEVQRKLRETSDPIAQKVYRELLEQ